MIIQTIEPIEHASGAILDQLHFDIIYSGTTAPITATIFCELGNLQQPDIAVFRCIMPDNVEFTRYAPVDIQTVLNELSSQLNLIYVGPYQQNRDHLNYFQNMHMSCVQINSPHDLPQSTHLTQSTQ